MGKTNYFLALCVDIWKTVRDTTKVCAFNWHQGRWPWTACYKFKFSRNFVLRHVWVNRCKSACTVTIKMR